MSESNITILKTPNLWYGKYYEIDAENMLNIYLILVSTDFLFTSKSLRNQKMNISCKYGPHFFYWFIWKWVWACFLFYYRFGLDWWFCLTMVHNTLIVWSQLSQTTTSETPNLWFSHYTLYVQVIWHLTNHQGQSLIGPKTSLECLYSDIVNLICIRCHFSMNSLTQKIKL